MSQHAQSMERLDLSSSNQSRFNLFNPAKYTFLERSTPRHKEFLNLNSSIKEDNYKKNMGNRGIKKNENEI